LSRRLERGRRPLRDALGGYHRDVRAAIALCTLALLAACGADAGVPSVTVDVNGVEVTCRAETGNLDPVACAEWPRS